MLPEWIQLEKDLGSPTRRPEETNKKENDFLLFLAQPQLQGALEGDVILMFIAVTKYPVESTYRKEVYFGSWF